MTEQLHDRCLVTSHFAANCNQMCFKCTLSNNTVLEALQNINKLPGDIVAGSGEEKGYYLKKIRKIWSLFPIMALHWEWNWVLSWLWVCAVVPARAHPTLAFGLPQSCSVSWSHSHRCVSCYCKLERLGRQQLCPSYTLCLTGEKNLGENNLLSASPPQFRNCVRTRRLLWIC